MARWRGATGSPSYGSPNLSYGSPNLSYGSPNLSSPPAAGESFLLAYWVQRLPALSRGRWFGGASTDSSCGVSGRRRLGLDRPGGEPLKIEYVLSLPHDHPGELRGISGKDGPPVADARQQIQGEQSGAPRVEAWMGQTESASSERSGVRSATSADQRQGECSEQRDGCQERAAEDRARERIRFTGEPDVEGQDDREEGGIPAHHRTNHLCEARPYVPSGDRPPGDRMSPSDDDHGDESYVRGDERRKDLSQHGPQPRRKKDHPRMNRSHPSHSHSPNNRKRPADTVMKERNRSESVGHSGPRTSPMPCQTRSAPTIPSHPTSAIVRIF